MEAGKLSPGIEPRSAAYQAAVLPLNHESIIPTTGLEPVRIFPGDFKSPAPANYAMWAYLQINLSGADGIRTHYPLLARQVLFQLSYNPKMDQSGLEPELYACKTYVLPLNY